MTEKLLTGTLNKKQTKITMDPINENVPNPLLLNILGIGGAAGYTTAIVVVGFNFRHKRNLAMGIALSGEYILTCN